MPTINILVLVAGMALINLCVRCPLFLLARRIRLPDNLQRALTHTPVAVLTAFVLPASLHLKDANNITDLLTPDLAAFGFSALVAWLSGNVLLTVTAGMSVAIGLRLLF